MNLKPRHYVSYALTGDFYTLDTVLGKTTEQEPKTIDPNKPQFLQDAQPDIDFDLLLENSEYRELIDFYHERSKRIFLDSQESCDAINTKYEKQKRSAGPFRLARNIGIGAGLGAVVGSNQGSTLTGALAGLIVGIIPSVVDGVSYMREMTKTANYAQREMNALEVKTLDRVIALEDAIQITKKVIPIR